MRHAEHYTGSTQWQLATGSSLCVDFTREINKPDQSSAFCSGDDMN